MTEKTNKPLVTCQFYGQLGNQLFIIATTLAYAWDFDATPIFPGLHTEKNRTSYNRDRLFFRLDASSSPRPFKHLYREIPWSSDRIPFKEDLILDGYFQSWKHFDHHREKLLKIFAPSSYTTDYLEKKYSSLLNHPSTVGVHIRTCGKWLHDHGVKPFLGLKYFQKAMDQFPQDSLFVICADRIQWCKKHLAPLAKNMVFIEGNYGIEDLFLLANCKHTILSNSTFSWWAAYLNQNPHQIVIAPDLWGGDPAPPKLSEDLLHPSWKIIPTPPIEAYPEDMYVYEETLCCDGNW